MKRNLSIGIDLGGTKTEGVVLHVAEDGGSFSVLARRRVATPKQEGYESVVEATAGLVESLRADCGLVSASLPVGVGMPGAVTRREGLVKNSNTVCLNGRPFRQDLSRRMGQRVAFENDANCFALIEFPSYRL